MIQKRRRFLWAKAHLKWTVAKWKTVLWSDESKFEVFFGKMGHHVIRTKEDKDNPSCYQHSVQKPASLMVWGCMIACDMGSLHIWKGTINAERYIQVLEQHMLPSRRHLFQGRPCIFQHDNARPHTASITTSCSLLRHGRPNSLLRHGRPSSLLRHGRPCSLLHHGRPSSLLHHGCPSSLLHYGRPCSLLCHGRPSSLLRHGHPWSLLRHGRPSSLLRHGRPCSLLRHGRPNSLLRHGRPSSLLRHGRPCSLLRHGRPSSLLHHGRPCSLLCHGRPSSLLPHGRPCSVMAAHAPCSAMAAQAPCSAMAAQAPCSAMAAQAPFSAMAAQVPGPTLGPGMGATLEPMFSGPSMPPEHPLPLPVGWCKARDKPSGRGGVNVSPVFLCHVVPLLSCPFLVSFLFSFSSHH